MVSRPRPLYRALFAAALLTAAGVVAAIGLEDARAHSGLLPLAVLSDPIATGTLVDGEFTFHWFDTDRAAQTGTATIDFFYTSYIPATFSQGVLPATLTGTAIVTSVLETDLSNAYTWDTSQVPPGTYWIWSIVHDPPMELNSLDIATFSPGVITVHHGSEPLYPAVVVTQPDSPFRWARENHFEIGYSAYDPDGSGKVKLEAFSEDDESDLMLIADDLPAVSAGTFDWSTLGLPEADYTLRATVTDGRGMSFVAHARFFLLVTDVPVRPDAGVADGGADAGTISPEDAGPADSGKGPAKMTDGGGCTCTVGQAEYPLGLLGLFLAAVLLRVRRKK